MSTETVKLNNGLSMPLIGFGTWDLRGADCASAVEKAIACGYRLIDTARMYRNEADVGEGIRRSCLPRSELFITSKVYRPDNSYQGTKQAIEQSLDALKTDYLDLYLIHEPYQEAAEMYLAMEEAVHAGKLKSIGISNFRANRFEELLRSCRIVPAVNQVEAHVFYAQRELQDVMEKHGTRMEAWSPLAAGKHDIFRHPVLAEIGHRHGKTAAQIALRYLVQRNVIVIPKSPSEERMRANLDLFDFALSAQDMAAITALDEDSSLFGWY